MGARAAHGYKVSLARSQGSHELQGPHAQCRSELDYNRNSRGREGAAKNHKKPMQNPKRKTKNPNKNPKGTKRKRNPVLDLLAQALLPHVLASSGLPPPGVRSGGSALLIFFFHGIGDDAQQLQQLSQEALPSPIVRWLRHWNT